MCIRDSRMLQMGTPGEQRDFHIRDGSAGQHASVLLFLQMGEHKPLPVPIQNILTAVGGKLQAASPLCRLQQQMDLGVMPERFKVCLLYTSPACMIPRRYLSRILTESLLQGQAYSFHSIHSCSITLPVSRIHFFSPSRVSGTLNLRSLSR